jgi:hypothetical protein
LIEHLKKLLRISGVQLIIKKSEFDELSSDKAKINYFKSLFDAARFTGCIIVSNDTREITIYIRRCKCEMMNSGLIR